MNEDSAETDTKAAAKPLNDLARSFRDTLRAAAENEAAGDLPALEESNRRAECAWEELLESATPAIERHARAQYDKKSEDYKDFISELLLILHRELTDLRESKDLWQTKFNLLLKHKAIKLAMRTKGKRRVQTDSLDEPAKQQLGGESKGTKHDSVKDEGSEDAHFCVELDDILRWVAVKLTVKHLEVFKLRYLEEWEWEEIRLRCEISERTARNYYDQTKELLREIYK